MPEAGSTSHTLEISPTGFELKSGNGETPEGTCVAVLKFSGWRREELLDQSVGVVVASSHISVLVGDKEDFQNQLRQSVNEKATELANEILKARANASSKSQ